MLLAALTIAPRPQDAQNLLADMLPWLILLLGLVIAGGVLMYWAKRSMDANITGAKGDAGFTLHELRELLKKGEISAQEFESARAALIGQFESKQAGGSPDDDVGRAKASDNGDTK